MEGVGEWHTRRFKISDCMDHAAVRQVAHRAREHVAARRPRMAVDPSEQRQVVERFLAALTDGDVQALMEVLAPDVVVVSDGGGQVPASLHPVVGAAKVVNFLKRFSPLPAGSVVDTVWLNGTPGGRIVLDGALDTAICFVVDGGRITRMYAVRNPAKLGRLLERSELAR